PEPRNSAEIFFLLFLHYAQQRKDPVITRHQLNSFLKMFCGFLILAGEKQNFPKEDAGSLASRFHLQAFLEFLFCQNKTAIVKEIAPVPDMSHEKIVVELDSKPEFLLRRARI